MPIQLTTPLSAGNLSSDIYDHVKIMRQVHDANRSNIMLDLEYGSIVDGKWVTASAYPSHPDYPTMVVVDGGDYLGMVTTSEPLPGELTYSAVKRGLYEWIQARYPTLAGAII